MDYEDAEISILDDYIGETRILIIESHTNLDTSVESIENKVNHAGHKIKSTESSAHKNRKPILTCIKQ